MYLDAWDHFIKEDLHARYYIRYTDDAVIIHHDPKYLQALIPIITTWFWDHQKQKLHPRKVSISKLSQGIIFLVTSPYHTAVHYGPRPSGVCSIE